MDGVYGVSKVKMGSTIMKKNIFYLMILISIIFLLKYIGAFSPKKVVINDKVFITTPKFYYVKLGILEFDKLDLSCYMNFSCIQKITLANKKSVSAFSLVFKNILNDTLVISISQYIKDSQETMKKGFGKIDFIKNECSIKILNKDSSICPNCIEYRLLKGNYHIDMVSNKKTLLSEKVNEICTNITQATS